MKCFESLYRIIGLYFLTFHIPKQYKNLKKKKNVEMNFSINQSKNIPISKRIFYHFPEQKIFSELNSMLPFYELVVAKCQTRVQHQTLL